MTAEQKKNINTIVYSGVIPFIVAMLSVFISNRLQAKDLDSRELQNQINLKASKEEINQVRAEAKEQSEWQKERIMVEIEWIKTTLVEMNKKLDK